MRRFALILTLLFSLTLLISAQEEPVTTEEPVTVQPPVEPTQPPSLFGDALVLLVNARNDLEILAGEIMGTARPEGWSGSLDTNNPQLPLLIRLDLEILMSSATGGNVPNGWFGAVAGSNFYIARDIRHDMELLADTALGIGIRPQGWTGGEPIWRCGRATQTLVAMLQLGGLFAVTADPASPTYCQEAELEAVQFSELNLLSNASGQPIFNVATLTTLPGAVTIQTDFAVAFLDTGASLRVGVIPNGTPVTPIGRSLAQFSNMMLVEGDGFAVFIDFTNTNVDEATFEALADGSAVQTFCAANWCGAG